MQRKIILAIVSMLLLQNISYGQYLNKLESLLSGSIQEKSLGERFTSDSMGYRRGLNPSDPEFDISYFFSQGFEANLKTELNMPSYYRQKNRISGYNIEKSNAEMRLERQRILADLSDKYLELTYNIKLLEFVKKLTPKDSIKCFTDKIVSALNRGDITKLDYTDLKMILNTIDDIYQQCENDIKVLTNDIRLFAPQFSPAYEEFPVFDFHNMTPEEFIEEAYERNPLKEILLNDSLISERELKLARWEWAPKIVVGARLDMMEDKTFSPAAIGGFSIPLWENRGNIKHSKSKIKSCAIENESRENEFRAELQNLYDKYTSAEARSRIWKDFDIEEQYKTLYKAYSLGGITASDYYIRFSNLMGTVCNIYGIEHEKASVSARMAILLER